MPNPGENVPKIPVPQDHEAFLRGLEHNVLVELSGIILPEDTGWRLVINQERQTREREVNSMRKYVPPVESPPYDPEADPKAYIDQIRQFNMRVLPRHDPNKLRDEKRQIREFADETVAQNNAALRPHIWNRVHLEQEELGEFFNANLRDIVLIPRMQGLAAFESQKYKTVRQYLPTVRINAYDVGDKLRDQAVTRTQIEAAKQAVLALPHTTPFPDFFQMAPEQQKAIVAALGTEWVELCKITAQHDPHALYVKASRLQAPLAYHSVDTLRQAIEQNPLVEPSKICRLFLKRPREFVAELETARQDAERRRQFDLQREAQQRQQHEAAGFYSPTRIASTVEADAANAESESIPDEPLTGPITLIKSYPANEGRLTDSVQALTSRGELWFPYPTDRQFDSLVELCTVLPADATYDLRDAHIRLSRVWGSTDIDAKIRKIVEAMPPGVITVERAAIRIGNIILAGRKTTAEDLVNERQRHYEEKKAEIDKDKVSIIDQDHARITINNPQTGEKRYYMPLDRGNALLAARIVAFLGGQAQEKGFVEGHDVASAVWAKMPTIERELFTNRKSKIIGGSAAIRASVLDTMRKLTNVMSITRETSGGRFKLEGVATIALHADSPESSDLKGFRPVYPPGTNRELIKQTTLGPIPQAALDTAKLLLEYQVDSTEPLDHNQAVGILDLITDAEVKRALRYHIKKMGLERTSANVLEVLRGQVEHALGESFEDTWRNRMIAGNHATGNQAVRLTGGELPIITNVKRLTTRKWHIAKPLA